MIFSDLYKSPKSPLSKLRSHPHPVAVPVATVPDLNADLVSKDKARQKEAVKRFLAEKVRTDWDFVWPPVSTSPEASEEAPKAPSSSSSTKDNNINNDNSRPTPTVLEFSQPISIAIAALPSSVDEDAPRDPGEEADSESDAESVYSTVSNDPEHFRPRAEWTSDLSDDERAPHPASPFRFDSPDAVGTIIKTSILKKKSSRRRQVRDEVAWNTGLACFVARRDAWTGAKTVRVKPKPPTPTSPTSPRRLFWRHHRSESGTSHTVASVISGSPPKALPLSPTSTHTSQQTNGAPITPPPSDPESAQTSPLSKGTTATTLQSTSSHESTPAPHTLYPVETLLPVAAPLLPPQNPMRASVTPAIYNSLYDKIVVHSLQPACPVNLADMLRTCVAGWKRDGEWPPRPTVAPMPVPTESMAAIRQRKAAAAAAAAAQHARKGSTATVGSSRRMSLGFLGGSKAEKTQAPPEEKDKDKAAENGSDGSAGKGIRRSLQKVFSLGHGHGDVLITPPA
ncbi:hypothetical protein B0T19DRAFT_266345 [Cercophora scortea]|uniref:Gag1-like clamp domain-containing protein n=1 Tax=Cercophora scortea TaxID=314031 RepID=A0AAE0IAB2_9PEZI|nr:hypothetical protein B0T19DRAFT_266345 [Cercophora scortea]